MAAQYCFPGNNSSCTRVFRTGPWNMFLFIFLISIAVCTVFLNLLVIISISHFKQLHTPTNLLILSLSVADLLVGLFPMPVNMMHMMDSCWYFGNMACSIYSLVSNISVSASVCSMVLIAVDRYLAVSDPLLYSTKITAYKTSLFIFIVWSSCLLYAIFLLYVNDHLLESQISTGCDGECVFYIQFSWLIFDLVVSFVTPCSVILVLYSIIFNVARRQAKAVRAVMNGVSNRNASKVPSSSEIKAAKTLGIVIFVYLASWIPFYITSLSVGNDTSVHIEWTVFILVVCCNSTLNPLIYAIFYSWFRESSKHILTCKIFEPSSSRFNLFREHF